MIKLILMDVDGTLVGKHGVHPSTWAALERARERGVHLGLCTGRIGCGQALEYARAVAPGGLHIFQSGAVASQASEALCQLVEISHREGQPLEAYTERGFFLE